MLVDLRNKNISGKQQKKLWMKLELPAIKMLFLLMTKVL